MDYDKIFGRIKIECEFDDFQKTEINKIAPNFIQNWELMQNELYNLFCINYGLSGVRNFGGLLSKETLYRKVSNEIYETVHSLSSIFNDEQQMCFGKGISIMKEILVDWERYLKSVENAFKPGYSLQTVFDRKGMYDTAIFSMWTPETYLTPEYINNHIAKFDLGYSFISFKKQDSIYTNPAIEHNENLNIGSPTGTIVFPKNQMNEILSISKGKSEEIEKILGYKIGTFAIYRENNLEMIRVDIEPSQVSWFKMSDGTEVRANNNWFPGGKNPKSWDELLIESIPKASLSESQVKVIETEK